MRRCRRCEQRRRWWPEVDVELVAVSIFAGEFVEHWAYPDERLLCATPVADR